jgi:phosphoglucomutase
MTLWDAMIALYDRLGYYKDGVQSVTMKGIEGLAKIQEIMTTLRENPPKEFCGHKVLSFRDYQKDVIIDNATGETKPTGLPKSNVLYFDMSDNVWMCVRPSGTEPKVKFYYGVVGTSLEDAEAKSKEMADAVTAMVEKMS